MFALSVAAIFILPAVVFGQGKYNKKMSIIIQNGDTTVNGKKLKELSPEERKEALSIFTDNDKPLRHKGIRSFSFVPPGDSTKTYEFRFNTPDSSMWADRGYRMRDMMPRMAPDVQAFRMPRWDMRGFNDEDEMNGNNRRSFAPMGRLRRDVQEFNFTNTDKNGIHTEINFRVSKAAPDEAKRIANAEKTDLELADLTLTPEFTSGKTLLNFSLTEKATADILLTNADGKTLWTAKATGSFTKSFVMPTNGYYYLVVKQAGKVAVKRIVKE